jgi:spermidine synthase
MVAMVCHGELARTRPSTDRLTLFYLLMSVGGALGGVFNALIAPVVFTDIYEYEIVMVLACFILPSLEGSGSLRTARWSPYRWAAGNGQMRDWVWALVVAVVTGVSVWWIDSIKDSTFFVECIFTGAPLVLCYLCVGRPFRLGLSLAVVLVTANVVSDWFGNPVLYQTRTFFGVLKVEYSKEKNVRKLLHGTINHGIQRMEPEARRESVSYFHPTGPYGQVFAAFSGPNAKKNIAVTGLGIAALVNYCEQGQSLTYYEIDPAVVTIAQDPKLFTYYNDALARGVDLRVIVGDARLKMLEAPDGAYDMIILDAFTSDAIPVHLLTREAMEMYLQKLAPGGLLVAHISNRYLALEPVLGNLAQTLGLVALKQFDFANGVPFKSGADLVVMARQREALGPLATDPRWTPVNKVPSVGTWSDDFSNVVSIIKWSN